MIQNQPENDAKVSKKNPLNYIRVISIISCKKPKHEANMYKENRAWKTKTHWISTHRFLLAFFLFLRRLFAEHEPAVCSECTNSIGKLIVWDAGKGRLISPEDGPGFGGLHSCRGVIFLEDSLAEYILSLDLIISSITVRMSELPVGSSIQENKCELYKWIHIPK